MQRSPPPPPSSTPCHPPPPPSSLLLPPLLLPPLPGALPPSAGALSLRPFTRNRCAPSELTAKTVSASISAASAGDQMSEARPRGTALPEGMPAATARARSCASSCAIGRVARAFNRDARGIQKKSDGIRTAPSAPMGAECNRALRRLPPWERGRGNAARGRPAKRSALPPRARAAGGRLRLRPAPRREASRRVVPPRQSCPISRRSVQWPPPVLSRMSERRRPLRSTSTHGCPVDRAQEAGHGAGKEYRVIGTTPAEQFAECLAPALAYPALQR